jgi:hypothetical protein
MVAGIDHIKNAKTGWQIETKCTQTNSVCEETGAIENGLQIIKCFWLGTANPCKE